VGWGGGGGGGGDFLARKIGRFYARDVNVVSDVKAVPRRV